MLNSSIIESVNRVILINNHIRRYYGKKYYRQAQAGSGGRTQAGFFAGKARPNKGGNSQGKVGISKN